MKVKDEKLFGASDKVYADSKAKGLYNESQDILDTLKQRKNAIIRMITKYNDLKDDAKVKEYEDKLREVERRIDNYSNSDKPMKMQEADKEDFESDMAHIEEFLNTKDGYATPEAEQILDTLYDDFITLSSKVHLDESADYPEDEKLTIDKYVATYEMPNGTFFELYKDEDGNMYDQNKVPIDAEELSKYKKVAESKKLKEGYYVKIFNSDNTDIDTYETNDEQEAIDYAENQKANGYRAVVYNADTKEALYDYDPNNVLEEDAWDDNFVINMLTDEKVYWKRKYDGKEIVTSFDIFKEPTDPTEWKSEEELTKYALEEGKVILSNLDVAEKVFEGIDIDEELVEETKTSDKLFDQLKELGMTKEQAESTVKAIVNIFKNKSPEIVKESVEDVLDNLSNETVDKVSGIISKIKNLGWDGNIDTIEDYYNKLFIKESKTLKKEAITELSNELYEIVEYMYNESEQDLDYIPEIEDIQDRVNEDCDENMYNKAVDIVRNIIENITYYEYDYKKYIQLSDNHTMYELNDDVEMTADQYSSLVDIFLQQLQDEINIDIYALGRSGRHICIDNTFDNALNYNGYVQAQRKYEQEMINYINQEYGNNKTENKKLNEDIKSNKYEIEWNAGAVERTPTPNETIEFEGTRKDLMQFLDDNYVDVDYDEDDNIISFEEWLDTYEDTYDPSGSTVVLSIKENGKEIYKNSDYDYYQEEQEDYDDDDDDDNDMEESKHLTEAEEDIIEQNEEETDNNILDLLQNRIGQNLTVGELNTILQGVLGTYNEVYLLTSDLYNMNPEEPQELVVFDDDDMYTITFEIEDMDNAIIQITDVELD